MKYSHRIGLLFVPVLFSQGLDLNPALAAGGCCQKRLIDAQCGQPPGGSKYCGGWNDIYDIPKTYGENECWTSGSDSDQAVCEGGAFDNCDNPMLGDGDDCQKKITQWHSGKVCSSESGTCVLPGY